MRYYESISPFQVMDWLTVVMMGLGCVAIALGIVCISVIIAQALRQDQGRKRRR